jgi:hypothetical protein
MQMVPPHSKSQRLPEEAALALRTHTRVVQSSYGEKANSLNVRDMVNRTVVERGEETYHRKTLAWAFHLSSEKPGHVIENNSRHQIHKVMSSTRYDAKREVE